MFSHICGQKWNLLCNREHPAARLWTAGCRHAKTLLSNNSHSGREADIQVSGNKRFQQHAQADWVVQGERKRPTRKSLRPRWDHCCPDFLPHRTLCPTSYSQTQGALFTGTMANCWSPPWSSLMQASTPASSTFWSTSSSLKSAEPSCSM